MASGSSTSLTLGDWSVGMPWVEVKRLGFSPCVPVALMRLSRSSYGDVLDRLRDIRRGLGDEGLMRWRFGVPLYALDRFPGLRRVPNPPSRPTNCVEVAPCIVGWPGHVAAITPWAAWPHDPPRRWWRAARRIYGPPVMWDDPDMDRRTWNITDLWIWKGSSTAALRRPSRDLIRRGSP